MVGMGKVVVGGVGEGALVVEEGSEGVEDLGAGSEGEAGMVGDGRLFISFGVYAGSMAFGLIKVIFMIANRLLSKFRDTQAITLRVEVQIQQLFRPRQAQLLCLY